MSNPYSSLYRFILTLLAVAIIVPLTTAQSNCTTVGCYHNQQCMYGQGIIGADGRYNDPCGDPMLVCQFNAGSTDPTNGTCVWKQCANTDYISGWNIRLAPFPQRCNISSSYCPDTGLGCLPLVAYGGSCDLSRDDECAAGLISMCLNLQCVYKTVGLGGVCGIETTFYRYAYRDPTQDTTQVVVRDNCTTGYYCNNSTYTCINALALGATCTEDRECISGTCSNNGDLSIGSCIPPTDSFRSVSAYVYVIIGVSVTLFLTAIFAVLWYLHRIQSQREREKFNHFLNAQSQYQPVEYEDDDYFNQGPKVVLTTPTVQTRGSEAYAKHTSMGTLPRSSNNGVRMRAGPSDEKYEVEGDAITPLSQQQKNSGGLQRRPSDIVPGTGIRYGHQEQLLYATTMEEYDQTHHYYPPYRHNSQKEKQPAVPRRGPQ